MAQTKTAAPATRLDAELARRLLTQMSLIRRFEEKAAEMYALGKIGGFLHLYIGQEAVAVGAMSTIRPDDYAISSYREHGHCLAKGSDPRRVMAELFGRRDGLSKGRGTAIHRALAQTEIWRFAETYGIRGEAVDGMDVLAVRDCVGRAVERARREGVPAFVEARTYRFRGHSMRDPAGAVYRTREEVEREKQRDPIALFTDRCVRDGVLAEADLRIIEKSVNELVEEAVAFADASPEPPAEWLLTDVYKD